jgi:hypothetical protein
MECLLEQGLKLERTKVGAGEKEHAFIVRKQQYLQITACLFVAFVVVASFGFFYRYELMELAIQEKELFQFTKKIEKNEQGVEARLVRMSSALQGHLLRDKREVEMLDILKSRQKSSSEKFKKDLAALIGDESIERNALLSKSLKMTDDYQKLMQDMTHRYSKGVYEEGKDAEARLHSLSHEILGELRAEIEEEREEDMEDAKFSELNDGAEGNPRRFSASMRLVKNMLKKFQGKVDDVEMLHLKEHELTLWSKLLDDVMSGKMDYDEGEAKMKELMETAQTGPLKKEFDDSESVLEHFEQMLETARLTPYKKKLLATLEAANKGEKRLPDVMLEIENMVEDGTIDPSWLSEFDSIDESDESASAHEHHPHVKDPVWPGM